MECMRPRNIQYTKNSVFFITRELFPGFSSPWSGALIAASSTVSQFALKVGHTVR